MKRLLLLLFVFSAFAFAQAHSNTLTWTWAQGAGDPATGFHIQRSSTSGGPYTVIATTSATTLTYSDTAVVAGQTNYYIVTAFNAGGDSASSNQVTCATPFQAPAAPTGLSGSVR